MKAPSFLLDITFGNLGASGMLEVYWRNPTRVLRDGKPLRAGRDYTYETRAQRLTVSFTGSATVRIEGGGSLFAAQ